MLAFTSKLELSFSRFFNLYNTNGLRLGLRVALAIVIATFVACILHLPKPYWAAFTVAAITRPAAGIGMQRALDRFLGTLIGGICGYILAIVLPINTVGLLLVSFIIMFTCQLTYEHTDHRYALLLGAVTALLVFNSVVLDPHNTFFVMINRISEISVGVACGLLVGLLVFPLNIKQQLNKDITTFMLHYRNVYEEVMNLLKVGQLQQLSNEKIKKLDTHLDKIRQSYDLLTKEPEYDQAFKLNYGNRIIIIERLALLLNTLIENYSQQTRFYWPSHFSTHINQIVFLSEKLLENLDKKASRQHYIAQLQQTLTEFDHIIADLRATKKLTQYARQDNQALYLFIDIHHALLSYVNALHAPVNTKKRIKNKFFIHVDKLDHYLFIFHSVKSSLAIVLALYCWLHTNWPGGLQGIVSSIVIAGNYLANDMRKVGFNRITGCFLGGIVGLLFLHWVHFSIFDLLVVLFLVCFSFGYLTATKTKFSYLFTQANYAFCLALIPSIGPALGMGPPLERLFGILVGITCMVSIHFLIFPINYAQWVPIKMKYYRHQVFLLLRSLSHQQTDKMQEIFPQMLGLKLSLFKLIMNAPEKKAKSQQEKNQWLNEYYQINKISYMLYFQLQHINIALAFERAKKLDIDLSSLLKKVSHILLCACKNNSVPKSLHLSYQQQAESNLHKIRQSVHQQQYHKNQLTDLNHLLYQINQLIGYFC